MAFQQNSINANATTPLFTTGGGSGISAPTAHGILVAEGASAFNPIVLANGQVLIGSTGADPVAATLTAGSGISITQGAGTITIANTAVADVWVNVTGTTQTIAPGTGYTASNAGVVTFTLPATAAYGTVFEVTTGTASGGWSIAQNALQYINFGNQTTTIGTGGSLASSQPGDSIRVVCIVANVGFQVLGAEGGPFAGV